MLTPSPWLHQLNRTRPIAGIGANHETDVAIIGGGIAGISTAYYTLKNTELSVTLVEEGKIAHGATGHNGGFLASYFERSTVSLIEEFGLQKTADAMQAMDSTWQLLDDIRTDCALQTPMWQFTGYAGLATLDDVLMHLRNNQLMQKVGLSPLKVLIANNASYLNDIPDIYGSFYELTSHEDILERLESIDASYTALLSERKGCMNSALFCEEVVGCLLAIYPRRFTLAEHTPVRRLVLKESHAVLDISKAQTIAAKKVVLCTNGFENINIINVAGKSINKKFHHMVRGIVGYMAGYIESLKKPPAELSFLPKESHHVRDVYEEEPYFYMTRRPFIGEDSVEHSLICVGGPEALMDDTNDYHVEHPYPLEAKQKIDNFLKYTYKHAPKDTIEYKFLWHGLMGFTPNGVRLIGPEPLNPILLYNLGCNGVGLLPSIYGGQKISWFLRGDKLPDSIFDPTDAGNIRGIKKSVTSYSQKNENPVPKSV